MGRMRMSTQCDESPETWLLSTETAAAPTSKPVAVLEAALADARLVAAQVEEEMLALQTAATAPYGVATVPAAFRNPVLQSIHQAIIALRQAAASGAGSACEVSAAAQAGAVIRGPAAVAAAAAAAAAAERFIATVSS